MRPVWLVPTLFLLAAAAGSLQAQPPRFRRVPPLPGKFATTPDSVRIWYRIVGSGPQTVLISAGLYHRTALDPLARGRRLVLFDPRGRGASDTVPPAKSTLDHELVDIETVRRAVGVDSFALIGWSALGLEAFAYAAKYPGRVTRLVQMTPLGARRNPYFAELLARRARRVDSVAEARLAARVAAGEFKGREADWCRARAAVNEPAGFGDRSKIALAPDVCDFPNEWPTRYADHARAALGSYGDWDWRPALERVTIPRLVIHGERDNFPLEGSQEWVAGQPNARLLVIAGAGHWVQYERPVELLRALDAFLRGHWPAGSVAIPR